MIGFVQIGVAVNEAVPAALVLEKSPYAVCTAALDCSLDEESVLGDGIAVTVVLQAGIICVAKLDRRRHG